MSMKSSLEYHPYHGLEDSMRQKVLSAKKNALSMEEYKDILEKSPGLETAYLKKQMTSSDIESLKAIRQRMEEATVMAETIPEARLAMELLGYDREALVDTLSHENAHGNKADRLGAEHRGYKFLLIRTKVGFDIQPQASFVIPREWDLDRRVKTAEEITRAPEEFENKLSEGDLEDLERMRNIEK